MSETKLKEDVGMMGGAPTNNVGSGNIAGLGIGAQGEPGVDLKRKKKVMPFKSFVKRKMPPA